MDPIWDNGYLVRCFPYSKISRCYVRFEERTAYHTTQTSTLLLHCKCRDRHNSNAVSCAGMPYTCWYLVCTYHSLTRAQKNASFFNRSNNDLEERRRKKQPFHVHVVVAVGLDMVWKACIRMCPRFTHFARGQSAEAHSLTKPTALLSLATEDIPLPAHDSRAHIHPASGRLPPALQQGITVLHRFGRSIERTFTLHPPLPAHTPTPGVRRNGNVASKEAIFVHPTTVRQREPACFLT